MSEPNEQVLIQLLEQKASVLYALYDCAQYPALLPALERYSIWHECLFDGVKKFTLRNVAPYLIGCQHFAPSPVDFVDSIWHKGVSMLVEGVEPIEKVKLQLKKNAFVKNSEGVQCYFRYYDARAFSRFIHIAKIRQLHALFGSAIRAIYWMDFDHGDILCLRRNPASTSPDALDAGQGIFEITRLS